MEENVSGCIWPGNDPVMQKYHDEEWGVPVHDDERLFEYLLLDTFQAGLNWRTILHKRSSFEAAFAGFDAEKVACFDLKDIARLLDDKGIIRNRLKIQATISNAQRFLEVQNELGSFDRYVWQFCGGAPVVHEWHDANEIPTKNGASDALSSDMKKRGFKFVGTTICYAFMQAAGLINDHLVTCPRHRAISEMT